MWRSAFLVRLCRCCLLRYGSGHPKRKGSALRRSTLRDTQLPLFPLNESFGLLVNYWINKLANCGHVPGVLSDYPARRARP